MAISLGAAGCRVFPPLEATHLVKLACELPDKEGRSLSLWTCAELARTAVVNWTVNSFDKVLAKIDRAVALAA